MPSAERIAITGNVLGWARDSAGLALEEVAERLGVAQAQVAEWESSGAELSVTQLRKLAALYRRPVPVLLRSKPPAAEDFPTDFRTIGGRGAKMSRPVVSALKRGRRLQRAIGSLPSRLQPRRDVGRADRTEDPDTVGTIERSRLGISTANQFAFANSNTAFNAWRGRLQALGVMVLVEPMPRDDCRGFALWDDGSPPAIVISNDEADEAKSFTALHEYGHLLLRESAACLELSGGVGSLGATEHWCNRFAAAVLAPADALEAAMLQLGLSPPLRTLGDVTRIARRLRVSRHVVALRLEHLGLARVGLYNSLAADLARDGYRPPREDEDIQIPSARRVASELGYLPALTVISAVAAGEAGPLDAAGLLKIPAGKLRDLRTEVERLRSAYAGA